MFELARQARSIKTANWPEGNDYKYLNPLRRVINELADGVLWASPLPRAGGRRYRLCRNYTEQDVCNWTVPADDWNPFCGSCRLTRVIPDLSRPGNKAASVPNCSAMTSGEWFGSMIPPEPTRMVLVPPATCPITTDVAALAMPGMLWCSASQYLW